MLQHIDRLLANLERPDRVPPDWRFEYGKRAARLLARGKAFTPTCEAMFLDEAQDLGPATIKLLAQLVKEGDPEDSKSRAINIFYDNAQNVYGRGTPKWIDLGIDVRGRSVIMKESFRSTKPIAEFALNALARLTPFEEDADQREYIERELVERTERDGQPWWIVHFNEIDGPVPKFKKFANRQRELEEMCRQVRTWIVDEQVSPSDIVVVTMGRLQGRYFGEHVATALSHALADVGARAEHRTSEGFLKDGRTVVVTTPHSFKGYEAELVYVPGVDQFHEGSAPLAAPLYVALTRARSVLVASGIEASGPGQQIVVAMRQVGDLAGTAPCVDDRQSLSRGGVKEHLQALLGSEHKTWLDEIAASYELTIDVMTAPTGEIIAEPLFVARSETARVAFYRPDDAPLRPERFRIEDAGFTVGIVGEPLTSGVPP